MPRIGIGIGTSFLGERLGIGIGAGGSDGTPLSGVGALKGEAGDGLVDPSGNRLVGTFANDNPGLTVRDIARRQGIAFGTSIQSPALMNAPGPAGFPTRIDWLSANTDVFVPGFVMMPDNFNPSLGTFQTGAAAAFVADARARGKAWRGHCAYYPKRDIGSWVDSYLQANPGQWQALQHARIDALASVPGIKTASNFDVINEVFSPGSTNPGGWRNSPWTVAAGSFTTPAVSAFQKMRDVLPNVKRYWCQDASEQLASTTFLNHANNIVAGIESCMNLGAPVDGYAMQAHLTYRLGFDNQSATRLRAFCRSLTETLGLELIVSELDLRTGYGDGILDPYGQIDTRPPSGYTVPQYDMIGQDITKRFLDTVLPFVKASGGNQFLSWTLDDGYNSWTEAYGQPPGERPCPYTDTFQPKPQLAAIRNALLEC
ncbi:endo-1,4-beta-xylanase [Aureimonas sp. SK2]|uniref:endo-1,4-beta-xylanase n=1 Tax=Aureimonas sp. SK2 TaxID=3015992 RepID=UPI0024439928|nr:endo-1,4-beta-xylanase [Aureimonas sp. SK2]